MKAQRTYTVVPRVPAALAALPQLAHDLGWIHDPRVRALFRELDPDAVDIDGLDPVGVLGRAPQVRLEELAADAGFVGRADEVLADVSTDRGQERWFGRRAAESPLRSVAYFSPEFGLAASVPQYSGGLGILAGDHLKAAGDLAVPLTGVGLFYRHGYFRQAIDTTGWQQERFPRLTPHSMAMEPVDELRVTVDLAGVEVHAAVWRASVDSVSLYLLDTEVEGNTGADQLVTDRLYGGGTEQRIRQELLLGVGGYRALRALGIEPDVFHLNEGHAGFLALEHIRWNMQERGLTYDEAVEAGRPQLVFTTHTPVPAGIDRFPRELVARYLDWWLSATGRTLDQFMELGAEPGGDHEVFNLAAMCLRLTGRANGVSKLHGAVSRKMFADVWPGLPTDEVPISSVTNGVHGRTWVSDDIDAILDDVVGWDWPSAAAARWSALADVSDERLWQARNAARSRLVAFARSRLTASTGRRRGASATWWCASALDPAALTIGFARRFATYKRATLLLQDGERLRRLLTDPQRPVQLVFAGKAHPADEPGKHLLREVARLADDPELRSRVVFVEDYDIDAGRMLTQGCDVWLNTPVRPFEACGTSGMKAALNGGLNLSVLDGWWDEWYDPEAGWAIPSADWVEDADARDTAEAEWIYELLEREVVPLFYERGDDGLPHEWVGRVRSTLTKLGPRVSADRMVAEYVERFYEPAARRSGELGADGMARARALAAWRVRTRAAWPGVSVPEVMVDEHDPRLGDQLAVTARVVTGELEPSEIEVEVVHGPVDPGGELTGVAVKRLTQDPGANTWSGTVSCDRAGAFGLAVRAVPAHPDLASWLDLGLVAWGPWPELPESLEPPAPPEETTSGS
ncbi:MAG: alpha-glucan family phosphorylase [Gaiella sp.]